MLCICEICNCGMHKCEHRRPPLHFDGETTSRTFHCPHALPEQPARPPPSGVPPVVHTFQGESTYKVDFPQRPLPEAARVPEPDLPAPLPLSSDTTYAQDYTAKTAEMEPLRVPEPKPRQPFVGETSYRSFHDQKPLPRRPERMRSSPNHWATPRNEEAGFEGESSYKRDFGVKPLPRARSPPQPRLICLPFEGESSYRREFTEPAPQVDAPQPSPRQKPPQAFSGETTYRQQHGEKPLPRPAARPKSAPRATGGGRPFDGASTYRSDFAAAPAAPESPRQPRSVPVAPDLRDFSTTYGREFVPRSSPVCPILLMPRHPHCAPAEREHSFWDRTTGVWR